MQAYEGYFENGNFHSAGRVIKILEKKMTIINILDVPVNSDNTGCKPVRPPFNFGSMSGKVWMADDFNASLDIWKAFK